MLELIQILIEEAENAIDAAFAEGYKQGLLVYAGELEYWRVLYEQSESTIKDLEKQRWIYGLSGFGIGFIGGGITGISLKLRL